MVRLCVPCARFVSLWLRARLISPLFFFNLQVTELITMEKVRIASNWPAVIKHTLRIVSILHYFGRCRRLCAPLRVGGPGGVGDIEGTSRVHVE